MLPSARLTAATVLALATCVASLSVAQTGKKERDKKRPAKTPTADASAPPVAEAAKADDDPKERPAAASDAGPPVVEVVGEAGARLSPLTPTPAELPVPLDAGAVDYDRLIADIATLRTRVAAVGEALFPSRMNIALRLDGDRSRAVKVAIALDDGVVYTSPAGFRADDWTPVFARALAPGRHAVSVDVERDDRENPGFRSSQRSRFIVEVQPGAELAVELRVEDDSTMGDLPAKKSGRYDLRVRMKAASQALKR